MFKFVQPGGDVSAAQREVALDARRGGGTQKVVSITTPFGILIVQGAGASAGLRAVPGWGSDGGLSVADILDGKVTKSRARQQTGEQSWRVSASNAAVNPPADNPTADNPTADNPTADKPADKGRGQRKPAATN